MIILLIIGILLTGLAIGSLARVTIWPRGGHMRSAGVPRRVEEYGFTKRDHGEESSGGLREKLDDVATSLGSAVSGRSKGRGDQHVIVQLVTPTRLNDRQRRALVEFAAASGEEVGETDEASLFEKVRNIFAGRQRD